MLLLKELTSGNSEIQKAVAFGGTFDLLFSIMEEENMNNGGIIVQDCLQVINSLLSDRVTSKLFIELLHKFPTLLTLEGSDIYLLTEDKAAILSIALETVSILSTGGHPQQIFEAQVLVYLSIFND